MSALAPTRLMAPLAGRRVLVVGGGQQDYGQPDPPIGIGRAAAVLAARRGAQVTVADLDPDAAQATAQLCRDVGAQARSISFDAADEHSSATGFAQAAEQMGGLDGVVLNTGIVAGWTLANTSAADWDRVFAVNVRAHFLGCKYALELMSAGGSVVLTSSTAAVLPSTTMIPAYVASKSALDGVCRYAAKEGAAQQVRVNVVMPGLIDTSLGRLAGAAKPDRGNTRIPLERLGTGQDVAAAMVFLLSGDAGYITGQTLVVDGGLSGVA